MQNTKFKTKTATSARTTLAASLMLAVSATAMFLSWGMLAVAAISSLTQPTFEMAIETPPSGGGLCSFDSTAHKPPSHGQVRVIVINADSQYPEDRSNPDRQAQADMVFGKISQFYKENSYYQEGLPLAINGIKLAGQGGGPGSVNDVYPAQGSYAITVPTGCAQDISKLGDGSGYTNDGCDVNNPNACDSGKLGTCVIKCWSGTEEKAVIQTAISAADKDVLFEDNANVILFADVFFNVQYHTTKCGNTALSDYFQAEGRQAYLNVSWGGSDHTTAHELGHALGVPDSGWFICDTITQSPDACPKGGYDLYDVMGANYFFHSSAPNKETFGWLQECSNALHKIKTVTQSGAYYLQPIEQQSFLEREDHTQALKIQHAANGDPYQYLHVEFRRPLGYDSTMLKEITMPYGTDIDVFKGALLHLGNFLFDAYNPPAKEQTETSLPFGQTYTDPNTGTSITLGSEPATGQPLGVTVTMGRTDFTPPIIDPLQLKEVNADCTTATYQVSAQDAETGISKIEVYSNADTLYKSISASQGEFTIDSSFINRWLYIRAYDNAKTQGGAGENNMKQFDFQVPTFECDTKPLIQITSPAFEKTYTIQTHDYSINRITIAEPLTNPTMMTFKIADNDLYSVDINEVFNYGRWDKYILSLAVKISPQQIFNEYSYTLSRMLVPGWRYLSIGIIDKNYNLSISYITINVIQSPRFVRGDTSQDGQIDVSDAITIFNYLFLGTTAVNCFDSADINNDELILPTALLY